MSVINEALKKAELERGHIRVGMPTQRAVIRMRLRWLRIAVAGALALAGVGGGIRIWSWLLWMPQHIPPLRDTRDFAPRKASQDSVSVPDVGPIPPKSASPESAPITSPPGTARAIVPDTPVDPPVEELQSRTGEAISERASLPQMSQGSRTAAETAYQKAVNAESKGAWTEAIRYYEEAIALDRTLLEARTNIGNVYVRQHRLPEAIEQFQAAVDIEPNYAVAHNNLGSVYLMIGQEARAVQEFLAAIRLDARYVSPYYNLGSLYARRGDVDRAISFLTKALAMEPAVLTWVRKDPDFDRIRAVREFQRIQAQAR